ncbi:thioredoxin family protein [Mycoplasmatota bacterium]|nr:thioredoxin family protein [Mycoplasmatota bacterium]
MKEIKNILDINSIIQKDLVIIIAKAKNCSVCIPVGNRLEMLLKDYPNIPIYQVYIDEVEAFRGEFLVFTVPTVLIFSSGKEILRESRFVAFNKIKRLLDLYVS